MSKQQKAVNIQAFNHIRRPSLKEFLLTQNPAKTLVPLGILWVLVTIVILFFVPGLLVISIILIVSTLFSRWTKLNKEITHAIMRQFAVDNGFTYTGDSAYASNGIIFSVGNNDHKSDYTLLGELYDYPFTLFWHIFSTGSGKHKVYHPYAVIELTLPKAVPHIFIDPKENNFFNSEVLDIFDREHLLELEGDFNKYFRIYAARDYQIATLTILNPAFMQRLINLMDKHEFELNDNKAFIYMRNEYSPTEAGIKRIFTSAEFIILELEKQLDTFNFTPDDKMPNELKRSVLKKWFK